jgi:C-methyltransferase-like protein/methyltransferase family protein/putative zinc binding protein
MTGRCYTCGSDAVKVLLDAGLQPIGNRFLRTRDEAEEQFPVVIEQCTRCGLVQSTKPVPAAALVPVFDWITYSEPEPHLDGMVDRLMTRPGIKAGAIAAGVSFKDDSTLDRLARRGLKTWRLDLKSDLGVTREGLGVETIQEALTPDRATAAARCHGPADVLLVRHILEHAHDLGRFLESLRLLLAPGGYVVIEVPDCSRAIELGDYTTLWEEHTFYYTPETFERCLTLNGFDVAGFENHPYPFENSLVAIAQVSSGAHAPRDARMPPAQIVAAEIARASGFATEFPARRQRLRRHLEEFRRTRGKIALFGAGHLACTFVILFGVQDLVECIVDDNPHKRGLFMPGSRLPIVGSDVLQSNDIALCLLSLNPIGEQKVMEKNQAFAQRGGVFASIFPASAHALKY